MQERIRAALGTPKVADKVRQDLEETFCDEIEVPQGEQLVGELLADLRATSDIEATEAHWQLRLAALKLGERYFADILAEKLSGRAELIYGEIHSFFSPENGAALDYGAGDGQVAQLLRDRLKLSIEGCDVRNYAAPGIDIRIVQMDKGNRLNVAAGHYGQVLMTNVLHHAENNQEIIAELTRVTRSGGKLVVIETVPVADNVLEFDRVFLNDWSYNRILHASDIPVPGTFETTEGWIKRFVEAGWNLLETEELGYDQPCIKAWHVRLVFERC